MHNISIRAVVLASLAVFGIDIISNLLLSRLFDGPTFGSGMTEEQVRSELQVLFQDRRYLTSVLIFGTASTILGGYLAARLAGAVPYFNALAFGVLGLTVSMLTSDHGAGGVARRTHRQAAHASRPLVKPVLACHATAKYVLQ
jgi:hypothetical protein